MFDAQTLDLTQRLGLIDPYKEVFSYECLYSEQGASLKSISKLTVGRGVLPSEVLGERLVMPDDFRAVKTFLDQKLGTFDAAIENTPQYPGKLHVAKERVPLLYYRGDIDLVDVKSVSVVGARKASAAGIARARRIARILAQKEIAVVSGLARGVDTAAMTACLENGGHVVGVIGNPIDEVYPKENLELQECVAREHLLVSQVPFYRYAHQPFTSKKVYFRERNVTMAAVSDATVIVEASDTSGSLIQARACIAQGRPLFIMKSCLDNQAVTWPRRFIGKGARVLEEPEQLLEAIGE